MTRRLILHTGTMKSGTSFLQNVLAANKARLADEHGILFPGRRWRQQVSAVQDLIERGGPGQPPLEPDGPWETLAAEVRDWPGDAVVSMEFLGPRREPKIRRILQSFPDHDLQVVMTARDLARQVPAMWQESVQNAAVTTWPDFLAAVRDTPEGPGPGRWFWNHQGIAAMYSRWQDVVGRDHLTLVTVPPPGSPAGLLWERFAGLLGVDPAGCSLDVRANPSIGVASALVLRDLNERLAADPLDKRDYQRVVKAALGKQALASRKAEEPGLGMDEPWVAPLAETEVAKLRALDPRLRGDLAELEPHPVRGIHTDDVSASDRLEAALDALAASVRESVTLLGSRTTGRQRRTGASS
ncbi:MAG TPA: hypothetical protein VD814_00380 [Nocardioides sp.]|nr:hypothetical protein [Nocardioides sp.]